MVFGRKKEPPLPSIMISPPQGEYANMPGEPNQPFPEPPPVQQQQQRPIQQSQQRQQVQQPRQQVRQPEPEPEYEPEEEEPQVELPKRKLTNKQARIIRTEVTEGGYFVSVVEHNYPLGIGWCELEQE